MAAVKSVVAEEMTEVSACPVSPPALILRAGGRAPERFQQFFSENLTNGNTRRAYGRALLHFLNWSEKRGLRLDGIKATDVAAYVKQHPGAEPTVKQALAAVRMFFDWLVAGRVLNGNPASFIRGPRHVVHLGNIDAGSIVGLRDRAVIGLMCYAFARVGVAVKVRGEDYFAIAGSRRLRLCDRDGKRREVPVHHNLQSFLDAYLSEADLAEIEGPLFRTAIGKTRKLSDRAMTENDVLRMIKRRAKAAGLPPTTCCHTFRVTGIVAYLENGGSLEAAQALADHESPRTTRLYSPSDGEFDLNQEDVERIAI